LAQRALNALSKSRFWANITQAAMIGDLRQETAYFTDPTQASAMLQIVTNAITDDTRVVIGHSLGSVIAYESLCAAPRNVVSFVTVGSPLGIRNVIFDRLTPRPISHARGTWPRGIKYWTNIADMSDAVALEKHLAPLFGDGVKDILVDNGADAHKGERYLTTREAGEAVLNGV
jgi:pimeloyl-ACP methyl ester carboxylesterase